MNLIDYIINYIIYCSCIIHAIKHKMFYNDSVYSDNNYSSDLELGYNNYQDNNTISGLRYRHNINGGTIAYPANSEVYIIE